LGLSWPLFLILLFNFLTKIQYYLASGGSQEVVGISLPPIADAKGSIRLVSASRVFSQNRQGFENILRVAITSKFQTELIIGEKFRYLFLTFAQRQRMLKNEI